MTFIDHQNRCVFNGSDLGRQYSAQAIQERCSINPENVKQEIFLLSQKIIEPFTNNTEVKGAFSPIEKDDLAFHKHQRFELLEKLISGGPKPGNVPDELSEELRLKRNRKKRLHL